MPIPDYLTIILPVLRFVAARDTVPMQTVKDAMIEEYHLTPDEVAQTIPSGPTTLIYSRVAWAVTYLVHAGLLVRPRRAHFAVTEAGRELLAAPPAKIDVAYLMRYPSFAEFMARGKVTAPADPTPPAAMGATVAPSSTTPEEQLGEAYNLLRAEIESQLLDRLRRSDPEFFEKAVLGLLRQMGYGAPGEDAVKHLGGTGDEGVDGVIYQDELRLEFIYVQAKRNAEGNTVSREQVQAFVGSLVGKNASKGVFFTTSTFSTGARAYANGVHQSVILIDGAELTRLMFDRGVGVRPKVMYPVKAVDEAYFEPE